MTTAAAIIVALLASSACCIAYALGRLDGHWPYSDMTTASLLRVRRHMGDAQERAGIVRVLERRHQAAGASPVPSTNDRTPSQ